MTDIPPLRKLTPADKQVRQLTHTVNTENRLFLGVLVCAAASLKESEDQMCHAQLALLDSSVSPQAPSQDGFFSGNQPVRYKYSKKGFICLKFVIVDVFPDGHEEFAEQEAGEVRWYAFRPTTAERAAFHRFIETEANAARWPLLNF